MAFTQSMRAATTKVNTQVSNGSTVRAAKGTKVVKQKKLKETAGISGFDKGKKGFFVPSIQTDFFVQPNGDNLWYPWATRPAWLDGSLPGDTGFDPVGFSKKSEFIQMSLDKLDQNSVLQSSGDPIGLFKSQNITSDLVPATDVYNVQRFRECELIHGRWCMLACLGIWVSECVTGVSWIEAGKVELEQPQWGNLPLNISLTQATVVEVLLIGYAEILRNSPEDPTTRCYPGNAAGYIDFDPLGLASDPKIAFNLKTAEIKHARLAMVGFFCIGAGGLLTGKGVFA